MTSLSKEAIQEFKDIYEKKEGKEISWEEASESARNLSGLANILYDQWIIDMKRKEKLKGNPKGFHIEGEGYTCAICRDRISNEETWYDKYGIKCLVCQKAVNKKIIPGSIAKKRDSWYSKYDLEHYFNINRHAMNKFIKNDILKSRIVPSANGGPHAYIFMIRDNKETLPPKKLVESKMVKETKDGKDRYHSEPWYRFGDPQELLKEYKILDYLKFTYNKY